MSILKLLGWFVGRNVLPSNISMATTTMNMTNNKTTRAHLFRLRLHLNDILYPFEQTGRTIFTPIIVTEQVALKSQMSFTLCTNIASTFEMDGIVATHCDERLTTKYEKEKREKTSIAQLNI